MLSGAHTHLLPVFFKSGSVLNLPDLLFLLNEETHSTHLVRFCVVRPCFLFLDLLSLWQKDEQTETRQSNLWEKQTGCKRGRAESFNERRETVLTDKRLETELSEIWFMQQGRSGPAVKATIISVGKEILYSHRSWNLSWNICTVVGQLVKWCSFLCIGSLSPLRSELPGSQLYGAYKCHQVFFHQRLPRLSCIYKS